MEKSNGLAAESLGFKDVTVQYNNAKELASQDADIRETNLRREIQFKASHVLLVGFFLWILQVCPSGY